MSMRSAAAWGAIGLGVLSAGPASAGPIRIDDFGTEQSIVVTGGNGLQSDGGGVSAPDAIGGARFASLTRLDGYGTDALTVDGGGFGRLDLSSAAADSALARLLYDKGTDETLDPTGLGGQDLTDGDTNGLIRILARSDLVAPIRITIYSDADNFSTATIDLPGLGFGATPFSELDLAFASFAQGLGATGAANFHSVGAIVVEISGESAPSLDAQLDSIYAVPEPRTAALFALGLAGLAVAGRRRA